MISKSGKPLVKLVPYEAAKKPRTPGRWEGKVCIAEDFDELPEELLKSFHEDDFIGPSKN